MKCDSCTKDQHWTKWVKITEYINFYHDIMVTLQCNNCGHMQTVKKIELEKNYES